MNPASEGGKGSDEESSTLHHLRSFFNNETPSFGRPPAEESKASEVVEEAEGGNADEEPVANKNVAINPETEALSVNDVPHQEGSAEEVPLETVMNRLELEE